MQHTITLSDADEATLAMWRAQPLTYLPAGQQPHEYPDTESWILARIKPIIADVRDKFDRDDLADLLGKITRAARRDPDFINRLRQEADAIKDAP